MQVVLETSKGEIVLDVREDWAPLGAGQFLTLVRAGYYDGAPWFRVIEGFVAQCGVAADPAVTAKWQDKNIQDEPVLQGNRRGTLSFGQSSQPHSRSTHIFINYRDNSGLDPQGFSAFAEVAEGMDVADSLQATGDSTVSQHELNDRGIEYFNAVMPRGDVIHRAYIRD